jgi:hypothetical protein
MVSAENSTPRAVPANKVIDRIILKINLFIQNLLINEKFQRIAYFSEL